MEREGFITEWHAVFYNPIYFVRKRLYQSVKQFAPLMQGDVLDFGCGAKPYRHLFTNAASYIGIDVEVSGHSHENEEVDVYYDGKIMPFEDDSFDHIFSAEVFEHVFNLEEILPEINRVLKNGGKLLITCPFAMPEHEKPYDYARYTSFGIKHLLEKNGFAIREQIKTGNYVETMLQLFALFLFYFLPKRPGIIYLIFHQIFILPVFLLIVLFNFILPKRIRRSDFYTNNVVFAEKII